MNATLICYELRKETQTRRTELNRKLVGYMDFSNKGKYAYKRKGLMSEIKHIKPTKSAFIVEKGDESQIIKLLKSFGAVVKKHKITMSKADFNKNS